MTRIAMALLLMAALGAHAARVTDTFDTPPGEPGRTPFTWWGGGADFAATDGVLQMRVEGASPPALNTPLSAVGVPLTHASAWTLEAGFRHVAGEPPRSAYETIAYVRWHAAEPGRMHILGLMYDASQPAIELYNATGAEAPMPIDLSGDFHAVRMAVADGQVRVWVDGRPLGEPVALRDRAYGTPPELYLGALTRGEDVTLSCEWSYVALTDDGAFEPGEGGWEPAKDAVPVAEGVTAMHIEPLPENEDTGINAVREKGSETWNAAAPAMLRGLADAIGSDAREIEAPFYAYPDTDEPPVQNIYPTSQALDCGD